MNQIRILILLFSGFLLWRAYTTNFDKSALLSDVLQVVDNNPQQALTLLENISPEYLYDSDKDQYMQFVVISTQARYMNDQDITGDSLILDAQRYFVKKQDYEMAARASFYAAAYWHEGEVGDKAVEYWQAAFHFAEQAGNNLFMAKSAHWLGIYFYNQEQWEDALLYCQQALELYKNKSNAEHYKLDLTNMLGHIYREQYDFERAYVYFNNGLETAKKLNSTTYESRFLRNKGLILRDKGEYRQAKKYFDLALSKQPEPEDKLRIYLSYAKLYRAINRPDSTIYYLNMIQEHIPEITYPDTRRDIYSELVTYYKSNQGDGDKIAYYSQLAHAEDSRIKKGQSDEKINSINQQLEQVKQQKQTEVQAYRRAFNYGIVIFSLLVSLLLVIGVNRHTLKERYQQIRQQLFFKTADQQHFWLGGLRSVDKSAEDFYQKELAYTGSPTWEELPVLHPEFKEQIAGHTRINPESRHIGRIAIPKLSPEDLCIIYFSQRKLSNEAMGWMSENRDDLYQLMMLRKGQIRHVLAEAGMSDKDIKAFLSEETATNDALAASSSLV